MWNTKLWTSLLAFAGVLTLAAFVWFGQQWIAEFHKENAVARGHVEIGSPANTAAELAQRCAGLTDREGADCATRVLDDLRGQRHDITDLKAQQDVAEWTFATFLAGAAGVVISFGGLWALVWTFREQRKLTQNESRAYIRVGWGELLPDPTYGLTYRLWLTNTGKTPATNISVVGELRLREAVEGSRTESRTLKVSLSFGLDELPADTTDFCQQAHNQEILDLPASFFIAAGSHYRKTGTSIGTGDPEEDGVEERLEVTAVVTYQDVFGGKHRLNVEQFTMNLEADGHLRGTGFRTASPH